MRPFPTNVSDSEWIRRVSELRREDIAEINSFIRNAVYENGFAKKTYAYTAATDLGKGRYYASGDTTSGAFTITLDADPDDGQSHEIFHTAGAGTLTASGNGNNINGAGTINLGAAYSGLKFVFLGSLGEWIAY